MDREHFAAMHACRRAGAAGTGSHSAAKRHSTAAMHVCGSPGASRLKRPAAALLGGTQALHRGRACVQANSLRGAPLWQAARTSLLVLRSRHASLTG